MDTKIERPLPVERRRVGNTTRLIDYYIQELFRNKSIIVYEVISFNDSANRKCSEYLFRRILKRLNFEHISITPFLNVDDIGLVISFKDNKIWR